MTLYELVEWWWLLHRARRDPGKFLERAAWHLSPPLIIDYDDAGSLLMVAAGYVSAGWAIPRWVFPKVRDTWV